MGLLRAYRGTEIPSRKSCTANNTWPIPLPRHHHQHTYMRKRQATTRRRQDNRAHSHITSLFALTEKIESKRFAKTCPPACALQRGCMVGLHPCCRSCHHACILAPLTVFVHACDWRRGSEGFASLLRCTCDLRMSETGFGRNIGDRCHMQYPQERSYLCKVEVYRCTRRRTR